MRFGVKVNYCFTHIFPLSLHSNLTYLIRAFTLTSLVWLLTNKEPLQQPEFSTSGNLPAVSMSMVLAMFLPGHGVQQKTVCKMALRQSWHAYRGQEIVRLLCPMFPVQHMELQEEGWARSLKNNCKVAKCSETKGLNLTSTMLELMAKSSWSFVFSDRKRWGRNSVYFSQDNKFVLAVWT